MPMVLNGIVEGRARVFNNDGDPISVFNFTRQTIPITALASSYRASNTKIQRIFHDHLRTHETFTRRSGAHAHA